MDHIFAENLCLSCAECNRYKGSDIASLDRVSGLVIPLFHPRREIWSEHFRLNGAVIEPISAAGRVTVKLLHMNDEKRLVERTGLIKLGLYPRRNHHP